MAHGRDRARLRVGAGGGARGVLLWIAPSIMAKTSKRLWAGFLAFATLTGALVAACDGCHRSGKSDAGGPTGEAGQPTLRVYFVSDLAGAVEPCGCQKDMLGGLDHFGALVAAEKGKAPNALLASAGPLFFMEEKLAPERTEQDTWKAEALAGGLKGLGLAAFAPGLNDWSAGAPELAKLRDATGGALLASNVAGPSTAGAVARATREIGGVKVAFVGVSIPKNAKGAPDGVTIGDASAALAREAKAARADGARIVVGLAAMARGDAIRAAEAAPDLDVLAIGSEAIAGDTNDDPKAPLFIGPVLVVQPSNHLTRVSAVDFFARGDGRFADGSGLSRAQEVTDLTTQIDDLDRHIQSWESDPAFDKKDVAAQKTRLAEMRTKLAKAQEPPPMPSGSFLRYQLFDVRDDLGKDRYVAESMAAYYKRVNEFNKTKFASKKAPPPEKGAPYYVGVDVCKTCHQAAYEHWKTVPHAKAYETLAKANKNFNLDCVGCHVTGYEKPGGSTVTDVVGLESVQCENCHGPGSQHIEDPYSSPLLDKEKVSESICTQCHHAPHTAVFDFKARVEKIKGPGHGKPGKPRDNDPPKDWKKPAPRFPG